MSSYEGRMSDERPSSKLTTRIDVPASEELADKLAALAAVMRKSKSELARELLTVQIEGMFALMNVSVTWTGLPGDGRK